MKYVVKSILQQIFVIPVAILYYKLKLQHKDTCHIIVCDHIGDCIYTMGYINTLKRSKGIERITIISHKRMEAIVNLYSNVEVDFKAVSSGWLHILEIADRYNAGKKAFLTFDDNFFVVPANWFSLGIEGALRFRANSLKECIKSYCLDIYEEGAYEIPKIKKQYQTKMNKILLCMDAESIQCKEKEKYEKMIKEKLQEMGYLVEVNGKDSYYPVEKIPSVCDSFYAIIGIRSGILDLATFSNTNVIALYPYESRQYTDYYDIKKTNERKENSWQIILSDNTQEDIQKIVRIIKRNVS